MAATSATAVKARIESGGLGLTAHRDVVPDGERPPYVTVLEAIAVTMDPVNARFDADGGKVVQEVMQVSLWQLLRDESPTLPGALVMLLDGATLDDAPTHVWGVAVQSMRRLPERAKGIVQHAITIQTTRDA